MLDEISGKLKPMCLNLSVCHVLIKILQLPNGVTHYRGSDAPMVISSVPPSWVKLMCFLAYV